MKVSDLNSAQIDEWVANAEGIHVKYSTTRHYWRIVDDNDEIPWAPHNDWALGGPIIERAKIGVQYTGADEWCAVGKKTGQEPGGTDTEISCKGRTPLEAAMKCYIAMKFGDEVSDI